MKKILPLANPPIAFNQFDTTILSVILQNEEAINWMYNNFIHISCTPSGWGSFITNELIFECRFLDTITIKDRTIINYKNLSTLLLFAIKNNYYIFLSIDEFYFSDCKINRLHPVLIYGISEDDRKYYIADFDQNSIYKKFTCSFDEFENAYSASNHSPSQHMNHEIYIFKLRKQHKYIDSYDINLDMIRLSLKDYLNAKYPYGKYMKFEIPDIEKRSHGIAIYPVMKKICFSIIENNLDANHLIFSLNYSHKVMMLDRVNYINKKFQVNYSTDSFNALKKDAKICLNLFLKFKLSENKNLIYKIIQKIETMEQKERSLFSDLINEIVKIKQLT